MSILKLLLLGIFAIQSISMFVIPPYHYLVEYLAKMNTTYNEYQLSTGQLIENDCIGSSCENSTDNAICKWTASCCFHYLKDNFKAVIDQPLLGKCENVIEEFGVNRSLFIVNKCPYDYSNSTIKDLCELKQDSDVENTDEAIYRLAVAPGFNIFQNKYCAICHGFNIFKTINPIRLCNDKDQLVINNASLPLKERLHYYNTKCSKIIIKNMLNGYPLYAEDVKFYKESLITCNATLIEAIVNKANIYSEEIFYEYLCLISKRHTTRTLQNVFCEVKLKKPKFSCYVDPQTNPFGQGPQDFKIPSFATLIDFKQPNRLFKTQKESEIIKEFCTFNSSVEIKSSKGDQQFDYCIVKTCKSDQYYNDVSKSCGDLRNLLKIEIKLYILFGVLSIEPIRVICEYLNEHYVKFPDCTRGSSDNYGWYYSNYGFYYPKFVHSNSYTFEVNSNKDTNNIIITFLFNTKSIEEKNQLKTFIQNDFRTKINQHSSASNATESIIVEDWNIKSDASNKIILVTKNSTINQFKYQFSSWVNKMSNQTQYPINCQLTLYSIFRSNDLSDNEIIQLMSLKLKVKKEEELLYDKVNNRLKHYHCPTKQYEYVYANSVFSDINAWINIIVIPISIGGLVCTCFTYVSFKKLRNLSGICATNLSFCLLLNYVLFFTLSLLKEARAGKLGCQIGAVLNHFSAVSVFTWSCCTAFEAYSMITRKSASGSGGQTRIIAVFVIGYAVPFVFVLICMSVWLGCGSNCVVSIGYTDSNTGLCWLRSGISVLIGMTIPAVLSCLTSMTFLALTIREIVMVMRQTSSLLSDTSGKNHRKMTVIITIKLAILLGLAWIFPSINILARSDPFDVFCNLFIACQGLMVSLCFLSTPKIRKLYRNSTVVSTIIKRGQTIIGRESTNNSDKSHST